MGLRQNFEFRKNRLFASREQAEESEEKASELGRKRDQPYDEMSE